MLTASAIPQKLITQQLQMQAESDFNQARLYKTQYAEIALIFYNRAKVTFRDIADARQLVPLAELKSAFTQAQDPQTAEDESLRQRIAEVYFERGEMLTSLGRTEKAQKSFKKAKDWGYEGVLPIVPTPTSLPTVDSGVGLAQSAELSSSKSSPTPSSKTPEACLEEKNQWVAQVFKMILKQFQDLNLCQSSSKLFLVYAHDNGALKERGIHAHADKSQKFITWLSQLHVNLYSDRTASGHQAIPRPPAQQNEAEANDILASQLCLLPNHEGSAKHVVLCGSGVLGHYMASPYYQRYSAALQKAYAEQAASGDMQKIEEALRQVVHANLKQPDFHHVLTELAFLQIRSARQKEAHGVIPMLLNGTAEQCFPAFIHESTRIRIEDPIWCKPSNWHGQTYQDEGAYIGFFKLLKRLFVTRESCISQMEKEIYHACLKKLRGDRAHTLSAEDFSLFLNQTCVTALDALRLSHSADLRDIDIQKAYESLRAEIKGEALVSPDQLRSILEASYSAKRLAIQRLSGSPLPMEHCYINLAIVEGEREKVREEEEKQLKGEEGPKESKEEAAQNYFYRLPSAEAIHSNPQKLVPLEKIFEPRALSENKTVRLNEGKTAILAADKSESPKRILIRGRAGVGKTTLSKKIVYEYTRNGQWRDRFDYVLWIPLRTLKGKTHCDLVTLFHELYFQSHPEGQALAKTLAAQINEDAKDKTLFVLDGWDEVAQEWGENTPMFGFLKQLLNQPAVVITSRPYVNLARVDSMNLELETVGFSAENVNVYLDNPDIVPTEKAEEIKPFIKDNAFIHELINVPIQLDALCYSWEEIKRLQQETKGSVTVASLYQAMMNKLWRKDMLRLDKQKEGEPLTERYVSMLENTAQIEQLVQVEHDFLSILAFNGLQRNQIEFDQGDLRRLFGLFGKQGVAWPVSLEDNLAKLSFLHGDESEASHRSYHFMHLTFQEFFAAKFFARHLQIHVSTIQPSHRIQATDISIKPNTEELASFIAMHKYNPRYEIFWWMVAGLLNGEALERFFKLLRQEPRDLIGLRHQHLMMGCLNEARDQLSSTTIDKLEREFRQWLDVEIKEEEQINAYSHLGSQRIFPENVLVQRLSQPKVSKVRIINTLGRRPTLLTDTALVLLSALKDEDSDVRSAAARALGNQQALSAEAMLALLSALKDEDSDVRSAAARALGNQQALSADAMLALASALKDKNRWVRSAAASALGNQQALSADAMLALASALKDEKRWVRSAAARMLGNQQALSADAMLALLSALKDEDSGVRSAAARALGNQQALSADAMLALASALKDKNRWVRSAAARALGNQQALSADAMLALLSALKDEDWQVRSAAARALGNQQALSAEAMLALLSALKDEDRDVRSAAARALGNQQALSAEAMLALLSALKDEDWQVRSAAASALGNQQALSAEAMLALASALKDEDSDVRSAAARALGNQQALSAEAMLALLSALKDEDSDVRSAAARALGNQQALSAEAMLALLSALKDEDRDVRSAAARALGNQQALSAEAMLALLSALKDEDWQVRSAAASALGNQQALSAEAMLALASALKDEDSDVRSAAASALGNQQALSAEAMLALLSALKDEDSDVRSAAARALGSNINRVFTLLSHMKSHQIKTLYTAVLHPSYVDPIPPLYIQDNQLYFYTTTGQSQPIQLSTSQSKTIIEAFRSVQSDRGITSGLKRQWLW